jgi:putative ABC transport system substrate-binding protein
VKRREFITLLGGAAAAWPLAARAQQQPKVLRIGIASANPRSFSTWVAFERRLRELGYVDGRNLTFEFIHLSKNLDQSKVAMRELINRKVDMIVDAGEIATLQAAMSQTRTMPIIMLAVAYDPLAAGYIESLARPGGNVTGVFLRRPELIEKQLEVLAEAFPGRRRLALLWDGSNEASFRTVEETAQKVRFDLQSLRLENPPYDFIAAFAKLAEDKPEVVFVLSSVFFNEHAQEIAQLAIRHALPTMFTSRRYVQARGAIVLRSGHTRHVSAGRRLCRSGRERVEAGGLDSRAAGASVSGLSDCFLRRVRDTSPYRSAPLVQQARSNRPPTAASLILQRCTHDREEPEGS